MSETITVAGKEFKIKRSAGRKRVIAGIDKHGSYYIGAPSNFPIHTLHDEITERIEALLPKFEKLLAERQPQREFREGETLYYCGNPYPLHRVSDPSAAALSFDGDAFWIREDMRGKESALLAEWYSKRLYERIKKILPLWTKKIKVAPEKIVIKSIKTRWGSCSTTKSITFSARLAAAPDDLLEYVVAHELVHMIHMDHSPAFWNELEKHMPDCKVRRTKLRKSGHNYIWW